MADSSKVVTAALLANGLVTVSKFLAGLWTGSSAMLSEAVHSLIDTGNEVLLLYGQHRAGQPADAEHPLGYGRELYFWSFIVALLIFTGGAGLSIYQGVAHIVHPEPITNPLINYAVLAAAFLFDGYSWTLALRGFSKAKGKLGWIDALRTSKDPPGFIVLFEDSADIVGLLIALFGTLGSATLHLPALDGIASIGIGLLLAGVAVILGRETKRLLIGEAATAELLVGILAIARAQPGVTGAKVLFSVQLSPQDVVVALAVNYPDSRTVHALERDIPALEQQVRKTHPSVRSLVVTIAGKIQ